MKPSITDGLVVKFARAVLEDEFKELRQNYDNLNEAYTHVVEDLEKVKDELVIYERKYKSAIDLKNYVIWDNQRLRDEKLEISEELKELQERIQKDSQDRLKLAARKAVKLDRVIACFAIVTALIVTLSAASYYLPTLPEEILAPVIIKECPKQVAGFYETWRGYGN